MRQRFDVAVVGSGFGGSILACRLAQAGRSVCVLERGRRWNATDFPRSPSQVGRDGFWNVDDGRFGIMEYRAFKQMHVIQGSGVGGGSLHYFNVHIRPPASIFKDVRWPKRVKLNLLKPYYDLAREMLDAKPLTPPSGRELPARTVAFQEACRRSRRRPELVPIAVHTGDPRVNPRGAVEQLPCDFSGNCALGCATNAKNAMDVTYLPLAERNGAEVRPLHAVEVIEPLSDGGYRVSFNQRDPDALERAEPGAVEAETVVVSAGTLGSNELLLRCRDEHKTLPGLSPRLGYGFSGNGDLLLAGTFTDLDVDSSWGPSITAGVDVGTGEHEAYIEDLGYPDQLVWFIEGMIAAAAFTVNPVRVLRILELFASDRLAVKGATDRISHEREALFGGGRTRGVLPYLGMCEDAADGRFVLDEGGSFDLRWNPRASAPRFFELERVMRELSGALDGRYVSSPLWDWPNRELLTAHPLGGCAMAEDRTEGVVDEYGEVHGYPGLFVADASVIPTALARNPSATISALSERTAFHMLHGRELRMDDSLRPSTSWPEAPAPPVEEQISVGVPA
jgi:cholesterol oxidase